MQPILSRNPSTGAILQEIQRTSTADLPVLFERSKRAQIAWSKIPVKFRAKKFKHLQDLIVRRTDEITALLVAENGKPEFEALSSEVLPTLDLIQYYSRLAPQALKDRELKIQNPFMRYRKSTLQYWPVGVVAVISPWNYPFYLAMGDIVTAIIAGNSVVFKPSEFASSVGQFIQELFDEAGFPIDLLQTVYGEGDLGAAIIDQKPNKISFTGSVATGKKVMTQAAGYLIPTTVELGGKDAMIVLPDADLDYATSAALWGGFTNSGQACASTERLLVPERLAEEFISKLKEKILKLNSKTDLGVCTVEKQKNIYEDHLQDARDKTATFYVGGTLREDQCGMSPTLVGGPTIESTKIYSEETFGPMIAISTYRSIQEAIQKANASSYGLLASVITTNAKLGEEVARDLQVGSVMINEVIFSAGLPETPWGGVKNSGIGRKHSEIGLFDFVNVRHVNRPRMNAIRFKSWWWFPYTPFQREFFRSWVQTYRGGWLEKLSVIPHLLWNLLNFIKNEPRL
jgi:acyl-CoA reductase-like NAD-dependent aldehyde dehydrogenase